MNIHTSKRQYIMSGMRVYMCVCVCVGGYGGIESIIIVTNFPNIIIIKSVENKCLALNLLALRLVKCSTLSAAAMATVSHQQNYMYRREHYSNC